MKRQLFRLAAFAVAAATLAASVGCAPTNAKTTTPAEPEVKNIILLVGDGMGVAQVTALMLARGYEPINIDRAQAGGMVKTWSANNRVTDSAASGTTYASGEKTNNGYLGVTPDGQPHPSILEKAEQAGMATGLVVTTIIQHATPGAFYAHNPNRNDYPGISLDLVDAGVDVAIGGGRKYLTDRTDGRNLWDELVREGYTMTESLEGLAGVTSGNAMALYEAELPLVIRGRDPEYLPRATAKALEILTANSAAAGKGFFLMVEGSFIDSAGHGNDAEMLLGEMGDFDASVGVAFDYADRHPGTLVIVTADHETGGLTAPSGNSDFTARESGIDYRFSTGSHTASLVPLFAYGTGAQEFSRVMDNTEISRIIARLVGGAE